MTKRVEGLRTKQASPPAEIDNDNYSTQNNYKNISKWFSKETNENDNRRKNKHKCPCPTCTVLGGDLIRLQYNNFNNILLEDDSKLIFYPMFEKGGIQ